MSLQINIPAKIAVVRYMIRERDIRESKFWTENTACKVVMIGPLYERAMGQVDWELPKVESALTIEIGFKGKYESEYS